MGDDITIGVTEIVNNIEVTAQPNDQIIDISVVDNTDEVTLNITPTVIEINVNKGSSYARWGSILGTLTDQTDLANALILKADLIDGLVPSYQLPSYVDDVIEVANYAALPAAGETGKIYLTLDNNHIYRWTGSTYVEITDNTAVWGAITGTLSSQTDLVNALDLRVPYTGATSNVNLGEYGLTSGYIGFDTTPTSTPTGIGTMYWDSTNRTVSLIDGDGDTTLQIGQEQRILVHNNTGSTLTDGQVVYVTGSTGNLPSVSLANASSETTSAATIGVVTESIAHGSNGFITTSGIVNGLNTLGFNEGDLLWLGTTAGTFTSTKPISPNHLVLIGYVIKKSGGNGSILVKIQNTQELEESSDVLFSGLTNNDLLVYESSSSLWKNKSIATILGYTPANDSNVVHIEGTETVNGIKTFSNAVKFDFGTYLKQDTTTSYYTGYTTIDGFGNGYTINNGDTRAAIFTLANNSSRNYTFPDANGTFALTSDLSAYQPLLTNPITGTGTTNYLPKFTGSTALGNSLLYDNGTNVFVGGSGSNSNRFTVVEGGTTLVGQQILMQNASSANDALNIVHSGTGKLIKGTKGVEVFNITNSGGAYFAGNVGIGTTSPSTLFHIYKASYPVLTIQSSSYQSSLGIDTSSGTLVLNNESNGALAFNTNATERMRITSGGNVGIGTTSPSNILDVRNDTSGTQIRISTSDNGNIFNAGWATGASFIAAAGYNSPALAFQTGGSERMRITSGGTALFGRTSSFSSGYSIGFRDAMFGAVTTNGNNLINFFNASDSYVASIVVNASTIVYGIGSDYRLKEDLKDFNGLEKVSKIKVYDFKFIQEGDRMEGVLAHELQEIVPYAVTGEKDGLDSEGNIKIQNVDYSKLVPILVKAIQEQQKQIDELKSLINK